jgi:PAS domain S-box-containing protein
MSGLEQHVMPGQEASDASDNGGFRPVRVLLIEDSRGDARLIREMLAEAGGTTFDVAEVATLAAGIDLISTATFDVVLLDLSLPDSDGLTGVARVKEVDPRLPVVVLTGLDDGELALRAVHLGAQDYLVKGQIESNPLARAIRYAIERREVEQALRLSEAKYRDLVQNSSDMIYTLDPAGVVTSMNAACERVLGWTAEEMLGRPALELVDRIARQEVDGAVATAPGGRRYEVLVATKAGPRVWLEVSTRPVLESGKLVAMHCTGRDITERKIAEEAMLQQAARERELYERQSEFVATVSHEFRTPLHSIRGFTRLLIEKDDVDEVTRREFLAIIDEQSELLTGIVATLLDIVKIESGKFDLTVEPVDLRELIERTVAQFETTATEKAITFDLDVPAILPSVEGDRDSLGQVLRNLVSNAVKFSHMGGVVSISAEASGPGVAISVRDEGIGIAPEAVPRVFDRFFRVESTRTQQYGGTGLGLYISKQIVELHGGRVFVKSAAGEGSTFTVTIPRTPPEASGERDEDEGRAA